MLKEAVEIVCEVDTSSDAQLLLRVALEVGEGLLKNGGEMYRVENAVERICLAYGAVHAEVFAIPSVLIASVSMADGTQATQIRRIHSVGVHLLRLERFNAISRQLCTQTPPLSWAQEQIRLIQAEASFPLPIRFLAAAIASGSFACFFGGNGWDGLFGALVGLLLQTAEHLMPHSVNRMAKTAILSFIGGLGACICAAIFPFCHADKIMIGTIMLLIPGLAFGNAIRSLLCDDLLAGSLEIVRAVLAALTIAFGYLLAMLCIPGSYGVFTTTHPLWVGLLTATAGTFGFAILFQSRTCRLGIVTLGGFFTYAVYGVLEALTLSPFLCALASAAVAALFSEICARRLRAPAAVFLLAASIPIVPGNGLYHTMRALLLQNITLALRSFLSVLQVGLGIACGTVFISLLFQIITNRNRKKG